MTTNCTPFRFPSALAFSSGYDVIAKDGAVGCVERPLFNPGENEPAYLVVRVRGLLRKRRRTVPASFVAAVDDGGRLVRLSVKRRTINCLPQRLTARPHAPSSFVPPPERNEPTTTPEVPARAHAEIVDRRITNVTHVLALRGSFLDDDIPSLSELLRGVVRAGVRQLVVDIRELESLSPRCLDVLVTCAESLAADDGQLQLACPGVDQQPFHFAQIDPKDLRRLRGLQPGLDRALAG